MCQAPFEKIGSEAQAGKADVQNASPDAVCFPRYVLI